MFRSRRSQIVYVATGTWYATPIGSAAPASPRRLRAHVLSDIAYAPFGEPYAQTGTDLSFTGMNSDTFAGLYDFLCREYSTQGRWPRPDPAGLAAADRSNPQSWNRYAYVINQPLTWLDPTGQFLVANIGDDGDDPGGGSDPFGGDPCFFFSAFCSGPGSQGPCEVLVTNPCGVAGAGGRSPVAGPPLKASLHQLFADNADCASILGGPSQADQLTDQMNLIDVPYNPYAFGENQESNQAWTFMTDSNSGKNDLGALTVFQAPCPTCRGWNGSPFNTFVGDKFANMSSSGQLGILIHEMAHPATGYAGNMTGQEGPTGSRNPVGAQNPVDKRPGTYDAYSNISATCGTAKPYLEPNTK